MERRSCNRADEKRPRGFKSGAGGSDSVGMRPSPAAVLLTACLAGPAGAGEIYRWTDDQGALHFSHELGKVPPEHRDAAIRGAARKDGASRLQTYGEAPGPAAPGYGALFAPHPAAAPAVARVRGGEIAIPFVKHGTLMMVEVRLNDRVDAPFIIDTGASGISIPRSVASELGLRIGSDTPRLMVQTASGVVEEPLVALASVQVGGARVENLDAMVSSSMQIGLLGGTFFNNFVYQVDAAQGMITLRANEGVRGGFAEAQWRDRFARARYEIDRLAAYIDAQDERDPRRGQLEKNLDGLRAELEALDREATLAGVPHAWRD
jgi:clan AA aspartic protease (TIGR02281 family)